MNFNISATSVRCVRQLLGPLFLIGSENAPANCHRPTPVLCLCPRSSIPLCLCLPLSPSPRSHSSISSGSMAPSHLAWSTSCGGGGASPSPPLQHQTGPRWRSGGGAVHARLRQWMSSARGPAMVEQCARRSSPSGGCSLVVVPHPRRGAPLKVFQRISGDALLYVPAASPSSLLLCLLMCAVNPISYMKQGEAISSRSRFRRSA